jgi:hypothetical protein
MNTDIGKPDAAVFMVPGLRRDDGYPSLARSTSAPTAWSFSSSRS